MTSLLDLELQRELAALRAEPPATGFALRLRERLQQAEACRAGAREPTGRVVAFSKVLARRRLRSRSVAVAGVAALMIAGAAAAMEGSVWRFVAALAAPPSPSAAPAPPARALRAAPARAAGPPPAPPEPGPAPNARAAPSAPSTVLEPSPPLASRRHERASLREALPKRAASLVAGAPPPPERHAVPRVDVQDPALHPLPGREGDAASGAARANGELPRRSDRWSASRELARDRRGQTERVLDRLRRSGRDPAALRERPPAELRERATERERDLENHRDPRHSRREHEAR